MGCYEFVAFCITLVLKIKGTVGLSREINKYSVSHISESYKSEKSVFENIDTDIESENELVYYL